VDILKLDFEKVFDNIEHNLMVEVMNHNLWRSWLTWMKTIRSSRTSVVMLNSVPRKTFDCKSELGKGFLHPHCSLFSQLTFSLKTPLLDFLILQYANGTLIIMEASAKQISFLKTLPFLSQASGKLELTNLVFSSLPNFYMCTLTQQTSVVKQVVKIQKALSLERCRSKC
jgi:hypothetical protein